MNTLAFLCVVLAIELGGPAIDGGSGVALSVSEAGRLQRQWQLEDHTAGEYRFSTSGGERMLLSRMTEPDLTYALAQYEPASSGAPTVGSVSLLPGARRIATIRRNGEGSLVSAELVAVSSGHAATVDMESPDADVPEVATVGGGDASGEPESVETAGDIVVTRSGAVLHVEHRGAGILVSLTGLRTQSR